MNAPRRPFGLFVERDQVALYILGLLLLGAVAARWGIARWGTGEGVRKLVPGDRVEYLVDINRAGVDELDLLPGIGPKKAEQIVEHRESHGPFRRVEDLTQVRGVSAAAVEDLRRLVTLGPASEGEKPPE